MKVVNVLSGKGGVGKSMATVSIAESLNAMYDVMCFDNDSQTPTLSKYKSLKATAIQIYETDEDGEIDLESLDTEKLTILTEVIEKGNNDIVLCDNGSSSFSAIQTVLSVEYIEILQENIDAFQMIFIIPVTADRTTFASAKEVLYRYGNLARYIIVENEHFGEVDFLNSKEGQAFTDANVKVAKFKIRKLKNYSLSTFEKLRDKHMAKQEALKSVDFDLREKSIIKKLIKTIDEPFLQAFNYITSDSE